MSFFMTIPFHWKELKQIFKLQKKRDTDFEDNKISQE
jgi:hypothetical protein